MNITKIVALGVMFLLVCGLYNVYADTYHYSDRIEIDGDKVMVSGSPWTTSQNASEYPLTNLSYVAFGVGAYEVKMNSTGIYVSDGSLWRKANSDDTSVKVCRGTSTFDNFLKKFHCDIVCDHDESDCQNEINDAINVLSSDEGEVRLMGGTYPTTAKIDISGKSNIHLRGVGWSTIIQSSGAIDIIQADNSNTIMEYGLKVSGMCLEGEAVETTLDGIDFQNVSDFRIENVNITNCGTGADGAGIYVADSENGIIENNHIMNCRNGYLSPQHDLGHNTGIIITRNYIYDSVDDAIHPQFETDVIISENVVDYFGDSGLDFFHVHYGEMNNNVVRNGDGEYGIEIGDSSEYSIVSGNTIKNNKWGFHGMNSDNIILSDNIFENNTEYAIRMYGMSHVTIENNIINDTGLYGIYVYSNSEYIHTIGNQVDSTTNTGIQYSNVVDSTISGNMVTNAGNRGIQIDHTYRILVDGNTVYDAADSGIYQSSFDNDSVISNNYVARCGSGSLDSGILTKGDSNVISSNTVIDCDAYGFYSLGGDWNIFRDNVAYDTRSGGDRTQDYGIKITGHYNTLDSNIFFNNANTQISITGTGVRAINNIETKEGNTVTSGHSTSKIDYVVEGNITITEMSGSGNDYACIDSTGKIFRSNSAC